MSKARLAGEGARDDIVETRDCPWSFGQPSSGRPSAAGDRNGPGANGVRADALIPATPSRGALASSPHLPSPPYRSRRWGRGADPRLAGRAGSHRAGSQGL